jgi:hypothetical protein
MLLKRGYDGFDHIAMCAALAANVDLGFGIKIAPLIVEAIVAALRERLSA